MHMLDTSANSSLPSEKSKNFGNRNAWKMQQESCYTAMLDKEVIVNCPTASDAQLADFIGRVRFGLHIFVVGLRFEGEGSQVCCLGHLVQ